jgi:rod shape-determining protein MreD
MRQLKIAALIAISVTLQASLRNVWPAARFLDIPLILVVYYALQRNALEAIFIGAICGIATDATGAGAILGTGGFSKTVVAFAVVSLASRMMIDNPLTRIPVLAGAALLDSALFVFLNRLLGNPPLVPFASYAAYKLITTTVVGAIIIFVADVFFSERANVRRKHASRRKIARRNIGSIARRR